MHHDPAQMQLNLINNFYHKLPNTEVHLNRMNVGMQRYQNAGSSYLVSGVIFVL